MATDGDVAARDAWVTRVLGVAPQRGKPNGDGRSEPLEAWRAARLAAITSLDTLAGAVKAAGLADAVKAEILLRAIRANLTETPDTPQKIAELRRYLEEDDVIDAAETPNGYGITVDVRDPLLDALDALEDAL